MVINHDEKGFITYVVMQLLVGIENITGTYFKKLADLFKNFKYSS